jgi:capsular polysaccharide biosynthesis protein
MKGRISGVAVDRFETVLSLRGHDEANYYHFFDDLLPRLRLIEELGLPQDVTVLVGRKLYEASYFQDAVNRSVFASLRFVPHINVVRANRLVFGHPGSLRIANFEFNVRALRTATPEPDPARLLFLTRARARGRYLSNEDAVQAEMRAAGFDVVETDGMSLDDQIAMFSGAAAVVAVHGAGVANIQFRMGRPMVLVELFAPDYVRPPFAWLCGQLGFRYDAVLGSSFDAAGAFAVDPRKLRMRVEELLAAEGA